MAHSHLEYLRLKTIISVLRYFDGEKPAEPRPDESFTLASRDGQREIKVNVYRSKITTDGPIPVLINWNGGAFVFAAQGADEPFCRRISNETAYTVLDASYALAPEYPFPSAVEDAEDVVLHVLSQPARFDSKDIVLSGFSSGGNLALAAASNLKSQSKLDGKELRAVVVFYPPTDMTIHPAEKKTLDGSLPPVPPVLGVLMNAFRSSYLPPGVDPADPRVSVLEADAGTFPRDLMIVTAEKDRLAPEAEALATKLGKAGKRVLLKRFDGVAHGWDKTKDEESNEAEVRDEAYGLVIKFLSELKTTKRTVI